MDLKMEEVARLLNVTPEAIEQWVEEGALPAYEIGGKHRFSRSEIEAWMMNRHSAEGFLSGPMEERSIDTSRLAGIHQFNLYRAIFRGGVYCHVPGDTKEEVIRRTMAQVARRFSLDADVLTDLLLDRERMMPTALGRGIGVPHTRDFLLNTHFDLITVVFPQTPLSYGALDGKPVHTLFFLFACEDTRHLKLLSKIAYLSSDDRALELLRQQPDKNTLLHFVKEWEGSLGG